MAINDSLYPRVRGIKYKPVSLTADDSDGTKNTIPAGAKAVKVVATTNGVTDYIVLPRLGTVENGHEITVFCAVGTAFEIRTPASSNDKINGRDSDGGTYEYLATDTNIIKLIKIDSTIGWHLREYTAIGAVVAAALSHAV